MLKSLTSVVLRLKENTGHLLPPPNPCWCRDTNLQPLDSKSNSRTIRPRLPNVSPSQNSCNCPITCCARSEETDLPFITFIRLRISIGKHSRQKNPWLSPYLLLWLLLDLSLFPRFPGGLGPSYLIHCKSVLHDPRQLFFAVFSFLKISGFKVFQSMHSDLQKSSIVLGELGLGWIKWRYGFSCYPWASWHLLMKLSPETIHYWGKSIL